MSNEPFSVSVETLKRGGVYIEEISATARAVYEQLSTGVSQYHGAGGEGDAIAETVRKVYDGAASASVDFLRMLAALLAIDGGMLTGVGAIADEANKGASAAANQVGDGKRG